MRDNLTIYRMDWITAGLYLILVIGGWLNIYAADFNPEIHASIFSTNVSSGRQLIWIFSSIGLITLIMFIDFKIFQMGAYIFYGLMIFLLIFVLIFGNEVAGSKSWFEVGFIKFQPSEWTKFATALALANFLSESSKRKNTLNNQLIGASIFMLPLLLIILQGDLGTAMVYGSLILVLYREGLPPNILIVGFSFVILFLMTLLIPPIYIYVFIVVIFLITILIIERNFLNIILTVGGALFSAFFVASVGYILNEVLKDHQRNRVMSLINPNDDPLGTGWNVLQSKIAIGSGGFSGKGYLQGTQTKFDFVPEQTTDFIFCTIGEEHGWVGTLLLITFFIALFLRLIFLAERQKSNFARVYGYCVASILFFHYLVNIAMTIGLFPVIGIPLPFFSYGGSSLWGFTILLFIFIKLDAHRMQVLQRM